MTKCGKTKKEYRSWSAIRNQETLSNTGTKDSERELESLEKTEKNT